jgi:hypothetical protein
MTTKADFVETMRLAKDIVERAPHAAEFVVDWKRAEPAPNSVTFVGRTAADLGWLFAASRFEVEGREGYMCVVTRQASVVNLPVEVAKQVFATADKCFQSQAGG